MAKGKVKYRDVVKKHAPDNKKFKSKSRKTYSLHKKTDHKKNKRKAQSAESFEYKKPKIEKSDQIEKESDEEELESDEEDHMTQLLSTFDGHLQSTKLNAIDTSESESESDEEEIKKIDLVPDRNLNGVNESENESEHLLDSNSEDIETEDNGVEVKENEEKINIENTQEDICSPKDPFINHFAYEIHDYLLESVQNNPPIVNNYIENWPVLGKLVFQIPKSEKIFKPPQITSSISEKKVYAQEGKVPRRIDSANANATELFIKSQFAPNLRKVNKSVSEDSKELLTPLQAEMFSVINNYQDFYYPERMLSNAEEIRFVYCLHIVNHVLKTRITVIHHNARLSKKEEVPDEFRDQGLVRPKVLVIVPFKNAAYKIIQMIINLIISKDKGNVINKNRFIDDYTGSEIVMPKKNPKPEDYEQTFQGNTSDDFKIGLSVTKKSVKLYANFYSSDIIVASPLGLRTLIGAEGEADRSYDFLASIELLILDQTEIFLMQNWDHVLHILNHLHLQPKDSHGTDFSRVRSWSLNGWTQFYRQTLIFSSAVLPEANAVFNKKCLNYAGRVKIANLIPFGCIGQVFVQIPHVFHRFNAQSAVESIEARFKFFIDKVLPEQKQSLMKQTLIFVPNYFDYVRIRNYFKKEDIGFVQICEYSKDNKIARARDIFFHGDAQFILYTERFHFFNRKQIKGIRHIVFYQLPNFSHFYYEMCNLMQESNMNKKIGSMANMTVTVLYSKYDVHQLSAVVSTERAAKMTQSDRKVHMIVTGAD